MIQAGKVRKGSVLLIESLDRLSRDEVPEALQLFLGIVQAGVTIVTLDPERELSRESIGDTAVILETIIYMIRAHEESAIKSSRAKHSWATRRAKLDTKIMTSTCPAWIEAADGCFKVRAGARKLIQRIFRMCCDGHGCTVIERKLNEEGVPVFAGKGKWNKAYIGKLLRNRRVLGEFQACEGRKPVGDVIEDYYPRIVDDATFYRAQKELDNRKGTGKRPQGGRRGRSISNLFRNLACDVRDKAGMIYVSKDTPRIVSSGTQAKSTKAEYIGFSYAAFEKGMLRFLSELRVSDIVDDGASSAQIEESIAAIEGELSVISKNLSETEEELTNRPGSKALFRVLERLETSQEQKTAKLEALKQELHSATGNGTLVDVQELIQLMEKTKGNKLADLRSRLQSRIRDVVSEIWCLPVKIHRLKREMYVQVHLRNGTVRQLRITGDDLREREAGSTAIRGGAVGDTKAIPESRLRPEEDLRNWPKCEIGQTTVTAPNRK